VKLTVERGAGFSSLLAAIFFVLSLVFVWRSFYGMRIQVEAPTAVAQVSPAARGE
jgi:K(+)-stimulated pyrophosphate-energized sodium pump